MTTPYLAPALIDQGYTGVTGTATKGVRVI